MEFFRDEETVLFKLVYYGPALCGKTTNLRQIYNRIQPEQRLSEILEVPTELDSILTFEFLPIAFGKLNNYDIKLQLYTVPGQVHYKASRQRILQKADGVVFVADSQRSMREQNKVALSEMKIYLNELNLQNIPILFQFNKQDLPDAMPPEEMARDLQKETIAPHFAASAISGGGVMETLNIITKLTKTSVKKSK